ncbi:hypothetical protein KIPB_014569, partial [Kipferlia bialata]|eukprot:g14569.t1
MTDTEGVADVPETQNPDEVDLQMNEQPNLDEVIR